MKQIQFVKVFLRKMRQYFMHFISALLSSKIESVMGERYDSSMVYIRETSNSTVLTFLFSNRLVNGSGGSIF